MKAVKLIFYYTTSLTYRALIIEREVPERTLYRMDRPLPPRVRRGYQEQEQACTHH